MIGSRARSPAPSGSRGVIRVGSRTARRGVTVPRSYYRVMRHRIVVTSILLAVLATSCSTASTQSECATITQHCHAIDPGSGPIHDCHEFAETSGRTPSDCAMRLTECLAVCVGMDAGSDVTTAPDSP